jgi:lipoyl-dependent peroxiredoxin
LDLSVRCPLLLGKQTIIPATGARALTRRNLSARCGMKRTASAVWEGDLKSGKGALSSESGVLRETRYSFSTRFENEKGTNPEELIAAAHAGCFAMALSAALAKAGHSPQRLAVRATVSLEQVSGGWGITASHLELSAKVAGIDDAMFQRIAAEAKAGCPVSKALNASITLTAKLESAS